MKAKCNNCINDCRRKQMNNGKIGMFHKRQFVMYADCSYSDMQSCNLHSAPTSKIDKMGNGAKIFRDIFNFKGAKYNA